MTINYDTAKPVFTWDVGSESWMQADETVRGQRIIWALDSLGPKAYRYTYRIEFYREGDETAVILFRYAENPEGNRFITPCPHGDDHAAKLRPQAFSVDALPPADLWYPSAEG